MAVVPGYKYLGPGNSINKGSPVNEVDLVAQIHDLEYSTAKNDDDVRKADANAIENFHNAPVSFGSLVGEVGIGVKYIVESETGVLYGGGEEMPGKFNIGQELYKQRQKAIYTAFRRAVHEGTHHDLNSFRNTDEYRNIIAEHKKGGRIYNQLLSQNSNAQQSTSERRPDDEPATSRRRIDSHQESDFDWEAYIDSVIADLPDETAADLPGEQSMDIPQSGSDRGPNTGARSQETSATATDGRSAIVRIPKSLPASKSSIIFKKSRILYSYGYASKLIQPATSVDDWFTTSMALIPVDFLPFYLTNSEYTSLPQGARIKEVTCNVYPLGTRTAFDTGTTLSGSATSEYIPIGLTAVGLNIDFYGCNQKYTTSATKPMVPTGIKNIASKEIVKKYYDHSSSNAMCIPRSISEYYCHNWNRSANPDTNKYPQYQVHNAGVVHMDQKVDQFLINTAINQPVVQYMYVPKNGYINASKEHYVPYGKRDNTVYSEFMRSRSSKLKHFEVSNAPLMGEVGLGDEKTPPVLTNTTIDGYNRKIENYGSFSHQSGTTSYAAQPQVHVGIQATPQLNPANEETNFLNSCAYWKVECTCIIDFTISSAFTKNAAISWPTEVHFLPQDTTKYTDGSTIFGNTDEGTGVVNLTMNEIIDEEFEMLNIPNKRKK